MPAALLFRRASYDALGRVGRPFLPNVMLASLGGGILALLVRRNSRFTWESLVTLGRQNSRFARKSLAALGKTLSPTSARRSLVSHDSPRAIPDRKLVLPRTPPDTRRGPIDPQQHQHGLPLSLLIQRPYVGIPILRTGDDPIRLRRPRDGSDHLVVLRENHQHNTLHDETMQTYLGQCLIQLPTIRSSFTVHLHIVIRGTRRDLCKRGSARHSADESRDIRDLSAENASPVKGPRESWYT